MCFDSPGYVSQEEALRNTLREPLRGLVLQTFGAGNAPGSILSVLNEATARGVIIINVTQCHRGVVEAHYAVGVALRKAGVVPGYDMTCEAALTKLGHVLAKNLEPEATRRLMEKNLRGELTPRQKESRFSFKDGSFISSVYAAMHQIDGADPEGARAHGEMVLIAQVFAEAPPSESWWLRGHLPPPPPPCVSYALVQATVGVGTVLIWDLTLIRYQT